MGFSIVENAIRTVWCATDGASTYYVGQLVSTIAASKAKTAGTVLPLAVPAGAADTTNFQQIYGVVVGTNNSNPTYATVGNQSLQYVTGVTTQAAQIARITNGYLGAEGMYSKSDPQPLIEVAIIGPSTVLKGDIYNGALGTACTVVTDQDGTDATGYTTAGLTDAIPFAPATLTSTYYCRSGANAGLYRTNVNTSTTAPDVTVAFPYNVALGDSFVAVPLKQGFSEAYIAGPGLYIDQGTVPVTNAFEMNVLDLNLEVAGKEHAIFCFSSTHFGYMRA